MKKDADDLELSSAEKNIRQVWLLLIMVMSANLAVLVILGILNGISGSYFAFLLLITWAYINYHCAYKNPGTRLLTGLLGFFSLVFLRLSFLAFGLTLFIQDTYWASLVFAISIYAALLVYYSFRLRFVNKKLQKIALQACPYYLQAVSSFASANDLQELNQKYADLCSSLPAAAKDSLSHAYAQRKELLN